MATCFVILNEISYGIWLATQKNEVYADGDVGGVAVTEIGEADTRSYPYQRDL